MMNQINANVGARRERVGVVSTEHLVKQGFERDVFLNLIWILEQTVVTCNTEVCSVRL